MNHFPGGFGLARRMWLPIARFGRVGFGFRPDLDPLAVLCAGMLYGGRQPWPTLANAACALGAVRPHQKSYDP